MHSPDINGLLAGLRFAVGTLSVFPVRVSRVDRVVAGWAMVLAPAVGLVLGLVAALPLLLDGGLNGGPDGGLLGAALAVGVLAVLTRGLHLDGLADLADGLGSGKPAAQAHDIMKKSDIGPFGVVALVCTLLIQVAAAAQAGPVALVVACVTGRLALTWACRSTVPAARPDGLGALVAGTVRPAAAWTATGLVLVLAVWMGLLFDMLALVVAVLAGLGAALLLLGHARRRLGGVTGDVLGALVETATATTLVAAALLT